MLLQLDDIIILSPGVKVYATGEIIKFITPKYKVELVNRFKKQFLEDLIENDGVSIQSLKLQFVQQYGIEENEVDNLINQFFLYDIFIKKTNYGTSLDFHIKSSYKYIPIGIRDVESIELNTKPLLISLPEKVEVNNSISEILLKRKSIRTYTNISVPTKFLSTILWSMYGKSLNGRTVPSAGALYPLNIYVVPFNVEDLEQYIYKYEPLYNGLSKVSSIPNELLSSLRTNHIDYTNANFLTIISGKLENMVGRYYTRGYRYLLIEVGHVLQNATITATALNISSVVIGGIDENTLAEHFHLEDDEILIIGMVFGKDEPSS
ncbi:SagB/ThcOx family dehydrogenase [Priestia flexa]|uniref:SagB/ThcOx family dehydrogenase n=1 Tax=Priestia flexa TaxID=86664 RepID=UPI000CC79C81|nr:SagB/ThcOx family dehydrogenase [Priestia flexa]MEC0665828.1 SagB/ThcOx family dehydrogenase [Priestia flexa]